MEWLKTSSDYSELAINNKLIGVLSYYNDCDEDEGFVFSYHFGIRYYDGEHEYFDNVSLEKAQELALIKVKEDFLKDLEELKSIINEIKGCE